AITWFLVIWSILVYAPMAHMVWGDGLLANLPWDLATLDFAGGTVVHICAGTTGLALAVYLGKRNSRTIKRAHSIPMVFFGCFLLWFGWFGFNGGSGLAANDQAISAMVVSMIASVFAMAAWAVVQYLHVGRVGVLGLAAGAIAGLVAITPGAGYVTPVWSAVIGLVGGVVCYFGVIFFRNKSGIDDALDVMGVHGVGGIWGAIATGLFAESGYAAYGGLVTAGDWQLFVGNIVAVVVTVVFCFVVSYAIIWVIGKFMRVRATESEELIGQDLVEHGEPAYVM
ncbi:MAG: ammonium transporter, partial [Thermoplasmata archaeon]|nr:ammonium transporter [Thermoplasmata archaeon]